MQKKWRFYTALRYLGTNNVDGFMRFFILQKTTKDVDVLINCAIWGGAKNIFENWWKYSKYFDASVISFTWYESKKLDGLIPIICLISVSHKLDIARQNAIFAYFSMRILMFENCTTRFSSLRLAKCSTFLKIESKYWTYEPDLHR